MTINNPMVSYLGKLCALQEDMMERYRIFIHTELAKPRSLNDASCREWSLSSRCYYLQKDNEALRELTDEYKKKIRELSEKVN